MRSGIRRANSQTEALQSLQEAQRTETQFLILALRKEAKLELKAEVGVEGEAERWVLGINVHA